MATGFAPDIANSILDALCRNVAWSQPAAVYVKLHLGDPGAAGTSNAATETTRQQATFGTAASGGAIANTVALSWASYPASEDVTHFSAWTESTAGTFLFSGTVTANPITSGNTFTIAIGDLDVTLGVAA